MEFLYAHPALFQTYLWLIMPVMGLISGLICGFGIRLAHQEPHMDKVVKGMEVGALMGVIGGTVALVVKYWHNPIGWAVITSEDDLIRSAVGFLLFVIVAEFTAIAIVRRSKTA